MLRKVLKLSSVVTIAGSAGLYYKANNDEGTKRSLIFWYNMFPMYVHYRGIQFLNRDIKVLSDDKADSMYEELHLKYAPEAKELVYNLKGFYLKQAQLLSTADDFVPAPYLKWFKDTQDNVPSNFKNNEAKLYVTERLKKELNLEFDDVFSHWDNTPIGVASIGQVHKAILKSNGKVVAVKILPDGIEYKFRSDIKTCIDFCRLAMPQHLSGLKEIEKQFLTEFDFVAEAHNLDRVRKNIIPRWKDFVDIPEPHLELCSKSLLVMDMLEGVKLIDGIRSQYERLAKSLGKTMEELESEKIEKIKNGTFIFKSIEEEKKTQANIKKLFLIKDLTNPINIGRFIYNYSPIALIYGQYDYIWSEELLDLGKLIELVCNVEGDQIFRDGFFNGDCHPGNILLLKDGRLGLIDYGQVKEMSIEERINYSKLIIAHTRRDVEEVKRLHFDVLKTRTKYMNRDIGYLMSAFYNDRNTNDVTSGKNLATFIDWLEAEDPMIEIPQNYIFAARVSLLLRGMGNAFGLQLSMANMWKGNAEAFLKSQNIDY